MRKLFDQIFSDIVFILKSDFFLVLCFMLMSDAFQRFFEIMMKQGQQIPSLMLPAAVGKILSGLLESVFLLLLIPLRAQDRDLHRPRSNFWNFMIETMKPLTLEGIRAFAIVLLWLPALIVPGIVKMLQYTFVPYVVLADPRYEQGQVDALEESKRVAKGSLVLIFLIQAAILGLELLRSGFEENFPFIAVPQMALLGFFGFSLLNIFINVLLFRIYLLKRNVSPPSTAT